MCGIAGFVDFKKKPTVVTIKQMLKAIKYRGPDSSAYFIDDQVALGINRLRIIDLKTGDQPLFNEDKTICVVFNGEIYNHLNLRKKLQQKKHRFSTHTDSEVLVHLYEEYQEKMVTYLEGMFAFAIWDMRKQQLFVARDRFGVKPLYYGQFGHSFVFGSEPKVLLANQTTHSINHDSISTFLLLGYIPGHESAWNNIHKLLPGHSLTINKYHQTVKCYWQLPIKVDTSHIQPDQASLEKSLQDSVISQLMADVPIGVFLSGGIDSSLIAYYASLQSTTKLKTFSVAFNEQSFDESTYSEQVARHLDTDHSSFVFTADDFIELFPQLTALLDEPFGDASVFPTYFLTKQARKEVTVCLSGEGGDELFGGYQTYQAYYYAQLLGHIPSPVLRLLASASANSASNLPLKDKIENFRKGLAYDKTTRHLFWTTFAYTELFQSQTKVVEAITQKLLTGTNQFPADPIQLLMATDTKTYLPDDLLVKSDRASMYNSLELRVPFLSQQLARYAFSCHSSNHVDIFQTKKLLRAIAKRHLPPSISSRSKKGFGLPLKKWFDYELKELVYDQVQQDELSLWISKKQRLNLLNQHYSHKSNHTKTLFKLMMLSQWIKNYV